MVVKEALHNVVGHASATVVSLSIGIDGHCILLEVADDGRGLPSPDAVRAGNGLQNMRARAAEMGGACGFSSPTSGTGTIVSLRVPVRP
jgi:signal transduction histidine kinase